MAADFKIQSAQGVGGTAPGGGGATGTVSLQTSGGATSGLTLTLNPSGGGQVSFSFGLASLQGIAQQDPNGTLAQLLKNATAPGAPTTFQVSGQTLAGLLQDVGTALPNATTTGTGTLVGAYTRKKLPGRLKSGQLTLSRAEAGPAATPQAAVDFFIKLAQEAGQTAGIKLAVEPIELKTNSIAAPPPSGGGGTSANFLKIDGIKLEAGATGTGPGTSALESAATLASLNLNTPPPSPAGRVIDSLVNRLSQGPPGQTGAAPGPPPPPPPLPGGP